MNYIIFIDVAGYTKALNENQSKVKEILSIYDSVIEKKVKEMSGSIISKAGDGYYIQCPTTKDPDVIIFSLQEIIKSLQNIKEYLSIRVGFHIGAVDETTERNIDINFAQRLESSAKPNQINISEIVYKIIKEKIDKYLIKEDIIDLKGFGETKIYRVITPSEVSITPDEYRKASIQNDRLIPLIIEQANYKTKVLIDEKNNKTMIETEYNDGTNFYAEMHKDEIQSKLDLSNFKLVLPPDEDVLQKTESIETYGKVVSLKYKWNAFIQLKYNSDGKLFQLTSENIITSISNSEKSIFFRYKFEEDKAIKISRK